MSKVEKVCPICGTTFYAWPSNIKRGQGIYCSKECRVISTTTKVERICPICGKVFYTVPSSIKKGGGVYCSRKCRDIAKITKVERVCPTCGKTFYVTPSNIKNGGGIYCSYECRDIAKNTKVERICQVCGNIFYTKPSRIKNGNGIYCSHECSGMAHNGERASGWKGGISFEPYCILFNKEFKERVRAFWGNKCPVCGKTEEESRESLCVHHVGYDKEVCCNDNERLFVPLCRSCHTRTNANREVWEEYFTYMISIHGGKCYYTKEEYNELKEN